MGLAKVAENAHLIRGSICAGLLMLVAGGILSVQAQDHFLGEIRLFAGNFAPAGWAMCDGSSLSISQNDALFALLGTMYGGDGLTTFALPDLRGRVPLGAGNGTGLTARTQGDKGGQESVVLTVAQIPAHTHAITMHADSTVATTDRPTSALPARSAGAIPSYGLVVNTVLASGAAVAASTGGGQRVSVVQPYSCITYIIALQGIFPSRN